MARPSDFDYWGNGVENGWSYETLRHYHDRSRCNFSHSSLENLDNNISSTHKCNEPLVKVTTIDSTKFELAQAFVQAGKLLRVTNEDSEFNMVENTIFNGQRWSTFHGYLQPAMGRPNLHILPNTTVLKVSYFHIIFSKYNYLLR